MVKKFLKLTVVSLIIVLSLVSCETVKNITGEIKQFFTKDTKVTDVKTTDVADANVPVEEMRINEISNVSVFSEQVPKQDADLVTEQIPEIPEVQIISVPAGSQTALPEINTEQDVYCPEVIEVALPAENSEETAKEVPDNIPEQDFYEQILSQEIIPKENDIPMTVAVAEPMQSDNIPNDIPDISIKQSKPAFEVKTSQYAAIIMPASVLFLAVAGFIIIAQKKRMMRENKKNTGSGT